MTHADFGTFQAAFRRLSGAYRERQKPGEFDQMAQTYFKTLEPYPLKAVLAAGRVCLETLTHFPKVAEWKAVLDRPSPRPAVADDVPPITPTELAALTEAEAQHWEAEPCTCGACVEAGVWHLPLRFVPTRCGAGELRARHPSRGVVVLGHWAHGDELKRWYAARDRFAALKARSPLRHLALAGVLEGVVVEREPGEEG